MNIHDKQHNFLWGVATENEDDVVSHVYKVFHFIVFKLLQLYGYFTFVDFLRR